MQVYKMTFPNGRYYFGSTTNVKRRWVHRENSYTEPVRGLMLKYGWDNIQKEIIWEGNDRRTAENIEYSLIELFRSNCYNVAGGIDGYTSGNPMEFMCFHLPREHRVKLYDAATTFSGDDLEYSSLIESTGVSPGVFMDICYCANAPHLKATLKRKLHI